MSLSERRLRDVLFQLEDGVGLAAEREQRNEDHYQPHGADYNRAHSMKFKVPGSEFRVLVLAGAVCVSLTLNAQSGTVNWPLHNLDLAGSRFSRAGSDQHHQRRVADAALAVSDRRDRRRQQSDDAGDRRRHDVCDRSARQRLRARRRRWPAAVDLRRHRADRRRRARPATSSATAASATPTASSTPPPGRSCSRSTRRPESRSRPSARTARPA